VAIREFRCKNYGICYKADRREVISVADGAPLVCPECKRPLEEAVGPVAVGKWKLPVLLALVIAAGAVGGYWMMKGKGTANEVPGRSASRPLRVGVVTWPGYAGGIVANNGFKPNTDCLYYKRHKLYVEFLLMEDVDARAKAFARGGKDGVDIVWSTVDFWANELPGFIKNDTKARAIMQVDWSRGGDAIVADKSITKIEDLYGKKISLALFTPSHWLLEYSLQNSSLDDAKQTQIVKSLVGKNASPDARADFVAGKVDAAVVWEPDVQEALQKRPGSHILVSSKEANKLIADLMVAREEFIRDHPDVIEDFIQGWVVDGTEEANRNPDLVANLLMQNESVYKDLGLETTKSNLASVKWADLSDNAEMFDLDSRDPQPLFDRIFTQAGKSWVARGYISSPVAPKDAKDDSFLRKIYGKSPVDRVVTQVKPAGPAVATQTPITTAQITVTFPTGGAVLTEDAARVIDERMALLPKTFSGAYIRVEGNTDNVGNVEANKALSLRRAQAVVNHLVEKFSLPREQFVALGNGPSKPVADNTTEEGRAKNRRTDVGVIAK
jgi:NitT/TauT family transport system substrate-binding protein